MRCDARSPSHRLMALCVRASDPLLAYLQLLIGSPVDRTQINLTSSQVFNPACRSGAFMNCVWTHGIGVDAIALLLFWFWCLVLLPMFIIHRPILVWSRIALPSLIRQIWLFIPVFWNTPILSMRPMRPMLRSAKPCISIALPPLFFHPLLVPSFGDVEPTHSYSPTSLHGFHGARS